MRDTIETKQLDDGLYVVSEGGTWVDGVYTTESAAIKACAIDCGVLHDAWMTQRPTPLSDADIIKMEAVK